MGITALLISCKHEEIDLPKINDFTYITNNAYEKNEVIKMEYDVLKYLKFNLLYPSPIKFFEYLSLLLKFDNKMVMMGKYLMESFLLDIKNIKYKASIIACACCYIVMKFFKCKNYKDVYDEKGNMLIRYRGCNSQGNNCLTLTIIEYDNNGKALSSRTCDLSGDKCIFRKLRG